MSESFSQDSLNRKLIFFTGKGGVGKTTLAWATAAHCIKNGKKVGIVSWSPFDAEPGLPSLVDGVERIALDTLSAFKEYALRIIKFEKVYSVAFENHVFKTFVKAAPGIAETVIAGKVYDLVSKGTFDTLLVDLPSSGHALSFFKSPFGVHDLFRAGFVHKDAGKIIEMFKAPTTRVDLVTLPEELPVQECLETKQSLSKIAPFPFGYVHLNRCLPRFDVTADTGSEELDRAIDSYLTEFKEQKTHQEALSQATLPILVHERSVEPSEKERVHHLSQTMAAI